MVIKKACFGQSNMLNSEEGEPVDLAIIELGLSEGISVQKIFVL